MVNEDIRRQYRRQGVAHIHGARNELVGYEICIAKPRRRRRETADAKRVEEGGDETDQGFQPIWYQAGVAGEILVFLD